MKFLKVLWSDIRTICKSKLILAALIAVLVLPLMYGGLYLASSWDPYGATQHLPVAVVNLDEGSEIDDSFVNYGDDVVDNLKENDDLGWQFVKTVEEAKKGLEGDKYYGMVVIPKDFSKKITDLQDGMLEKPRFIFMGNKKKNYIVGLICDKAATALDESLSRNVASNFADIVIDKVYDVRDGLEDAANGTAIAKDGVTELKDKVPVLENGISKLFDGADTLNLKLDDARDGSETLKDGVGTLKGKMPDLVDGVNRLFTASDNMTKSIGDAYDGSVKLKGGALELESKLPDLTDGVDQLTDGSESLKEGLGQVNDKMPDLLDGVDKLKDGAGDLRDGLKKAVNSITDKLGEIEDKKEKDKENKKSLKVSKVFKEDKEDKSLKDQAALKIANELKPIIPSLISEDKLPTMVKGLIGMESVLAGVEDKVPKDQKSSINSLKLSIIQDKEDMTKLTKALRNINDSNNINEAVMDLSRLLVRKDLDNKYSVLENTIRDSNKFGEIVKIYTGSMGINIDNVPIEKLPDELKPVKIVYDGSKKISTILTVKLQQEKDTIKKLKDGLNMYQLMYVADEYDESTVKNLGSIVTGLNQLYEGSEKLYKGLDELYTSSESLSNGLSLLHTGSKDLEDGLGKFSDNVPALSNGVSMLSDGTRDLSDGLFKLNKGSDTFTEKVGELREKAPDLEEGVSELYDGTFDLSDGLVKLHDGSGKLRDGLETLKDKMPDLRDGVDKLYEGLALLKDKMAEGAEKVADKLVNSSKATGEFIGEPIDLDDTPLYEVDKYGVGLAPYFISLALWVGALLMFFVVSDKVPKGIGARPTTVVLSKYLAYCVMGAVQAILVSLFVMKLGLVPVHTTMYFVFNVFLSFVFVAVAQNFVFIFGDAGKMLVIVGLLLQLTSSGGTFPKELLPSFFQKINPYMPFTHSIAAMKEINSGMDVAEFKKETMFLVKVLVAFLTATMLFKRISDKIRGDVEIEGERARAISEIEAEIEAEAEKAVDVDDNGKGLGV